MKTKKITLNELRLLIKKMINEDSNIPIINDGDDLYSYPLSVFENKFNELKNKKIEIKKPFGYGNGYVILMFSDIDINRIDNKSEYVIMFENIDNYRYLNDVSFIHLHKNGMITDLQIYDPEPTGMFISMDTENMIFKTLAPENIEIVGDILSEKRIIKEKKNGIHNDGQMNMFLNQKQVNRLDKERKNIDLMNNPTPKMVESEWNNFIFMSNMNDILEKYDLYTYGEIRTDKYIGRKIGSDKTYSNDKLKSRTIVALDDIKKVFKYPNKLILLNNAKQYAPEIKEFVIGIEK